jgi:hypothetical protein
MGAAANGTYGTNGARKLTLQTSMPVDSLAIFCLAGKKFPALDAASELRGT